MATPRTTAPPWTQEPLIPVHWPVIDLVVRWHLPADSTPAMVSYDVTGHAGSTLLLAKGIEWCRNIHDAPQWTELQADLFRIALEHLSPF